MRRVTVRCSFADEADEREALGAAGGIECSVRGEGRCMRIEANVQGKVQLQ